MKIDRRSFLSFVIGGAAGTALSPLPWKLTDDLSIWTQMWPWTPVPKDGEINYVNSTCGLCPGGCGITVRRIDDRAVKIEGMKGHPVNDGGICILGLSGLQLLYGPTRVKTPLKRKGSRGSGKWEKISWDEALSEVARKLEELRSSGQAHTLGFITGSDRGTVPRLIDRFMTVFGSPNLMSTPSIQDSYEITLDLMQGVQARPGFDFENADFILSFGSGIIEGWGSPVRMFKANSSWRERGAKVVQIEPRLSNTAAKSDRWIPINPGTEAQLALGLANVILQKSLYNAEFIEKYSAGFEEWKQVVLKDFSPAKVAAATGIHEDVITDLAAAFARASKPLAICGRGQGNLPGGMDEFVAVHALNALVGGINRRGGIRAVEETDYINWPEMEMDSIASVGMQQERLDDAGSRKYPYTRHLLNRLAPAVESQQKYPLQALFVAESNPVYTLPDSAAVKKAFEKIPFVVSFSSFLDETALNADLVLPNHSYLERYEDIPAPFGHPKPMIGLAKPVVKPQFNTRHLGDVMIRLAKDLGGSIARAFPWKDYQACLEETLGDKWGALISRGFWAASDIAAAVQEPTFETPSGKFEFVNKDAGLNPGVASMKIEGEGASYPLILIPYDSTRLASNYIGDPPFLMKTVEDIVLQKNDVFIEINPETAKSLRLAEGKTAVLVTPRGKAEVRVHLFDGIMPGVVGLPRGLGHTAYDEFLGGKGVNYNALVASLEDPVSGLDAAWGIRAKLSKA